MDKKTKRLLKVAHEPDREPYLIVRDSCRVLRTLASLGEQAKVKREVSRLIVTAESEQHPIRRGDALLLIAHSVQQMDPQLAHLLERVRNLV
jgi:hypothetical protein